MDLMDVLGRRRPTPTTVIDPTTVTVVKGPSFGVGPILTVIHQDGPSWTAMPARGSRWIVIDRENRQTLGYLHVKKVRGKQRWKSSVYQVVEPPKGCKARSLGMFPDHLCGSREMAIQLALACLLVGQDAAGVFPLVKGGN